MLSHRLRVRPVAVAVVVALAAALLVLGVSGAHARGGESGGAGATYFLNNAWTGVADRELTFGARADRAYTGDWDGDGRDSIAVRRGTQYYLTDDGRTVGTRFVYGRSDDVTLVGDWDGDGVDTLAVRRGSRYFFTNRLEGGPAERELAYGRPADQVLVGDWDGDGVDTLAVRRGSRFYFADRLTGGRASREVAYGREADRVYVGDWDGDRRDTPAVRRGATYFVTDRFAPGPAGRVLAYGRPADSTLVGDWDGDRRDTLGVRRDAPVAEPPAKPTRVIYLPDHPRVLVFGDSWTWGPAGANERGYAYQLGDLLGGRSTVDGAPGSGYQMPGATDATFVERIERMKPTSRYDLIVVQGSLNDRDQVADFYPGAVNAAWDALAAKHPGTPIVILGPAPRMLPVEPGIARVDRELARLAAQRGWWYISPIAEDWITARDYRAYINPKGAVDELHPTIAGHRALAKLLAADLERIARFPWHV
ncbi:SGNH/GDSL hydrolase family protein [Microbacterium rhizophilus]|uniref:SGNH/GDSL hydrolase family protein n=1 Tax=Microbacterium rhizophilus TaxID=3138934 RepID=UPI0031E96418